jgi:hypothetical protein
METTKDSLDNQPPENTFSGKKYWPVAVVFLLIVLSIVLYRNRSFFSKNVSPEGTEFSFPDPNKTEKGVLEESGKMKDSASLDWWLNSGGIMNISEKEFSTNLGKLPKDSKWRKLYKKNNSRDTDDGYHPQNIFRLVTKGRWQNFTQEVYFNIDKINLSESEYRNESNGVLLFNRYQDGDNLYYTGLRVDGHAVIKKKVEDKYYTLAEKNVLTNGQDYDRVDSPNVLPENTWVGLKSEVTNIEKDTVDIKLYLDQSGNGNWQMILDTQDKNGKNGKKTLTDPGYGGIRTDFMDVSFRGYKIIEKKK